MKRILIAALSVSGLSLMPVVVMSGDEPPLLPKPEVVESKNGILDITIEAAPAEVTVAGQKLISNVYNGQYLPPVLKVRRGDHLHIKFINNVGPADVEIDGAQTSNLHYHGMNISPKEPSDNVSLVVPSGNKSKPLKPLKEVAGIDADNPPHTSHGGITKSPYMEGNTYQYTIDIPPNHPEGINWYHSHSHGYGEQQVLSGMSGVMVVGDFLKTQFPELDGLNEQLLMLKDFILPGANDDAPKTKTINSMIGGRIDMKPGEWQVWNLANIGADAYFDFAIDGHKMWVLALDSNVVAKPEERTSVLLPPAARAVVAVRADEPGDYDIRTLEVDTGPQGDPNPEVKLAVLHVAGEPSKDDDSKIRERLVTGAAASESLDWSALRLGQMPITRKREIVFSETEDGNTFFINGKEHSWDRIDTTVTLGDVEEWTLKNVSGERHVFHIHQLDFLVKSINNQDTDFTGLRDTIDIPPMVDGVPGEVKVVIPFTDPVIIGQFVYHCHILEHGDNGMMANIEVKPKP